MSKIITAWKIKVGDIIRFKGSSRKLLVKNTYNLQFLLAIIDQGSFASGTVYYILEIRTPEEGSTSWRY